MVVLFALFVCAYVYVIKEHLMSDTEDEFDY